VDKRSSSGYWHYGYTIFIPFIHPKSTDNRNLTIEYTIY